MTEYPILYVILNGELRMSAGKAAAQAVHAAMLGKEWSKLFTYWNERSVIVLEARNTQQIKNLKEYLQKADVHSEYYIDEGVNEVETYSITALAVEPFLSSEEEKRKIFSSFPLYGSNKGIFNNIKERILR